MNHIEINKKITDQNIIELRKNNNGVLGRCKDGFKWIEKYINKNNKILDIGCRDGTFLEILKNNNYNHLYGCEISETAVKYCHEKKLNVLLGEFNQINFNQKFDVIILTHVLEHVPDPKKMLLKIYDLLNYGGKIFIEIPIQEYEDPKLWGHFHTFKNENVLLDMMNLFTIIKKEKQTGNSKKPWFRVLGEK